MEELLDRTRNLLHAPIHPILLALFPVISLWGYNVNEMQPSDSTRAAVIAALLGLVVLLIVRLITRSWRRAAIVASLLILMFGTYGHFYNTVKSAQIMGVVVGRHRYLLPLWLMIGGVLIWITGHPPARSAIVTEAFNIAALAALATACLPLVGAWGSTNFTGSRSVAPATDQIHSSYEGDRPDIYYIILDGYARGDTLDQWYDYNNDGFLDGLRKLGFFVADGSTTNYFGTALSLSSSLNMDYLQDLPIDLEHAQYPRSLTPLLQHSLVQQRLEELGYATVAFPTGYYPTEIADADYYLQPDQSDLKALTQTGQVNTFESLLLRQTVLQALLDLDIQRNSHAVDLLAREMDQPRLAQRSIVLGALSNLELASTIDGPKFVFAHIVSPHPPYVFTTNGGVVSEESLAQRVGSHTSDHNSFYLHQLEYISTQVLKAIDAILANSSEPPIIIVQADHGPDLDMDWLDPAQESLIARSRILNAYHVPGDCRGKLYSAISPVNSFRVIFRCQFNFDDEFLPDQSYFSPMRKRGGQFEFVPLGDLLNERGNE